MHFAETFTTQPLAGLRHGAQVGKILDRIGRPTALPGRSR
jgi:hypothetical protein